MVTPELLDFIRTQLSEGMSQDELSALLLADGGWNMDDVRDAFRTIMPPASSPSIVTPPPVVVAPIAPAPVAPPVVAQVAPEVVLQQPPTQATQTVTAPVIVPAQVNPEPKISPPAQVVVAPAPAVSDQVPIVAQAPTPGSLLSALLQAEVKLATPTVVTPVQTTEPVAQKVDPLPVAPVLDTFDPFAPPAETPVMPVITMTPPPSVTFSTQDVVAHEVGTLSLLGVTEEAHSEQPIILPGEDFLGIFDSSEVRREVDAQSSAPQPTTPPTTPAGIVPNLGIKNVEIRFASASPVARVDTTPIVVAGAMDIELLSRGQTPLSADLPITPTLGETTIDLGVSDGATVGTPGVMKFNFDKVRGGAPGGIATAIAVPTSVSPNTSRDSLVANFNKASPPQVGVVTERALTPGHGDATSKSTLFSKRTMASDILLHGMSPASVAASPSVRSSPPTPTPVAHQSVELPPLPQIAPSAPPLAKQPVVASLPPTQTSASDIMKKNRTKRVLGVAVGSLLVLAFLGGVGFVIVKYFVSNAGSVMANALTSYFAATSLSYKADANIVLVISDTQKIEKQDVVKFVITSQGAVKNESLGFGDGQHLVGISGSLPSVGIDIPTELKSDISVLGSTLFFHITQLPSTSDLDRELFNKYWVKVDLAEIAQELSLSGVLASGSDYGNFAIKPSPETSFNGIMKTHNPLLPGSSIENSEDKNNNKRHVSFTFDPAKGLDVLLANYRKYMGKELVLTDDERIRIKDVISKITGELWVGADGVMERILLQVELDDTVMGSHYKGKVSLDIALSSMNAPVNVGEPTPILTLEELKVQMEKYHSLQSVRVTDEANIERLHLLEKALADYRQITGRYPEVLKDMYATSALSTSTISAIALGTFAYVAYVNDSAFVRSNRCVADSQYCDFYHLGINLRSGDKSLLIGDIDQNTDLRGDDNRGCSSEQDAACFDVTSPKVEPRPVVSPATTTPVVSPPTVTPPAKPKTPVKTPVKK